jgi:hypothetical protein
MKIAILISGRVNDSREMYENLIENIVQNNEVDFFVSHVKNPNPIILKNFTDIYKPKIIIESNEDYPNIDMYRKQPETNKHNTMCMYLNRELVFNHFNNYVISNNIKYDLIISSRCELLFYNKIDLSSIVNDVQNNFLCIPNGHDWGGINDHMAFGNIETINIYMNLFKYIINILDTDVTLHPETLLKKYLEKTGVNIKRPEIQYRCLGNIFHL